MNEWETTQHQAQNGLYGTGKGEKLKVSNTSTTGNQHENNRQL